MNFVYFSFYLFQERLIFIGRALSRNSIPLLLAFVFNKGSE